MVPIPTLPSAVITVVSLKEANEYLDLKPKEWFKDLLSKHGLDKKEITKINKL